MVTQSAVPAYLGEPLRLMGQLRSTLVEDVEKFLEMLRNDPGTLRILSDACEGIAEHGDQVWLQQASTDYRHRMIDKESRRSVIHLVVVFGRLAAQGVPPFDDLQWRAPMKLIRADYVPNEIQPLVDLGVEVARASGECAVMDDIDQMSPSYLTRLHSLGEKLSHDPALASTLKLWLQHRPNAVEVEMVQRVLGILEFLGYQW